MNPKDAAAETRHYGRSASLLMVAVGAAGLLTYIYFSLASHSLDEEAYGEIVVLWSASFLFASTMFRPVEQLLARSLADRSQSRADRRHVLGLTARLQGAMLVALLVALLAARSPVERELLSGDAFLYWMLLVALAGFAVSFFARGFLAGRAQFRWYAVLVLAEVVLRLAFLVPVVIGVSSGAQVPAIGIAAVGIAALIAIPPALRQLPLAGRGDVDDVPDAAALGRPSLTLGSGGAFTGAVLLMMLGEQILVTSGALIVRVSEGAAAAGFIFNVLLVARAPLVLFQGVIASLLPHLSRLHSGEAHDSVLHFKRSVNRTIGIVAAFSLATTLGVLVAGPPVMELAFGGDFEYDRTGLAIVAAGMGFYLAALTLNQAALATGAARVAAAGWVIAAIIFVGINLIGDLDPFRAVEIGFAASAAVLAIWLQRIYARALG